MNPSDTPNFAPAPADTPRPAAGYAGDITPALAWQWLQAGQAVLVDVRTDAEREWVGFVPGAVPLAWKQWPGMALNPGFDAGVKRSEEHTSELQSRFGSSYAVFCL